VAIAATDARRSTNLMRDGESASVSLGTFRLLVEESLTGIYLIQNDRFVYVNRRFAEMFGYTREEVLALGSVMDLIAEADRPMVAEKLRQRLDGEIDSVEYSIRGLRKDGQRVDLDARGVRTMHESQPAVMGSMADITNQKRVEEALRHLSLVDELTGVYNRRGFMTLAESHLTLARRRKRDLLLVFADVDHLKSINDTFGHGAGDQVLVDAAAILRRTYRSADIIARIGGDEFTAFPLEAGSDSAGVLLERLQTQVEQHNREVERPFRLSMSVGVGKFDPTTCQTVQQLLEEADAELYSSKRRRSLPEMP
jgi:diguanylate cyclase (GGDEF)-like protein/PAS domain S-box-containing protein